MGMIQSSTSPINLHKLRTLFPAQKNHDIGIKVVKEGGHCPQILIWRYQTGRFWYYGKREEGSLVFPFVILHGCDASIAVICENSPLGPNGNRIPAIKFSIAFTNSTGISRHIAHQSRTELGLQQGRPMAQRSYHMSCSRLV